MTKQAFLSAAASLALAAFALPAAPARAADKVDFAKQVRPIFAESCYKCHGPEKQKGELRMDNADALTKGGKDGAVLVAGNVDKSDLYRRLVLKPDDDDIMPPKGGPLPKEKVEVIKQWIAEGASFGGWKADTGAAVAGAGGATGGGGTAPAEVKLPQVAAADPAALDKIRQAGATVLPLAQNTNLLEVSFPSAADKVNDDLLGQLGPIAPQVAELNLAGTKVTDTGLTVLEKFTNLRRLHLEKTTVGDGGLAHLKNLKDLEYLNLYNTGVTDGGLTSLEPLKGLKKLYLWQSKATDAGAGKLKSANPNVTIDLGWKEPPEAPKDDKKDAAAGEPKKDEAKPAETAKPKKAKKKDAAEKDAAK